MPTRLTHAAGQLHRQGIRKGGQSDQFEKFAGARFVFGRAPCSGPPDRTRRSARPSAHGKKVLLPGTRRPGPARVRATAAPSKRSFPAGYFLETGEHVEQGRFPAAGKGPAVRRNSPSSTVRLTSLERADLPLPGIGLGDAVEFDRAHGAASGLMRLQATPRSGPQCSICRMMRSLESPSRPIDAMSAITTSMRPDVIGIPQHIAEAGFDRHHLGDDHRGPADAEADPQAGNKIEGNEAGSTTRP